MKKYIVLGITLLSILAGTSSTYAGGWFFGFTYDQTDVNQVVDSIKDASLKDIVSKNLLQIAQNSINEDYDYNNKTYYTKKLLVTVSIPEELKNKVTSAYISLWAVSNIPSPIMYDAKSSTTTTDTSSNTELKIDINKDSIPTEIKIKRSDLDTYVKDPSGASFNGKLILVLTDGTKLPYSNIISFYIMKDNNDGKIAQLSTLYYTTNPSSGWANTAELLKQAFDKLSAKYPKVLDYTAALEKVSKKIDTKIISLQTEQTKLVSGIYSEEDFPKLIDPAAKIADKLNILNDIKYQISSEIKTKQSQWIIDDIFSEDTEQTTGKILPKK